ncbi:MAG: hypothetical protein KC964_24115, partial [Candidatus Omnitrophica bacterium]|nr:hypothetical protein [Candidatus Omnitrophota bacterium]
ANADILVDMATDVIKIPLEAIKGNSENKKVTLLNEKPDFVPPKENPEEEKTDEAKDQKDTAEDDPSEDYYKTEFELKRKYEESETKVVTGISNELWTEVVEGVTEGVVLKLPELKLPERREDFF